MLSFLIKTYVSLQTSLDSYAYICLYSLHRPTYFLVRTPITSLLDKNWSKKFPFTAWNPVLSGCYRPWFALRTDSLATENNVVLPDQPVVVMVAERTYDHTDPGYDAGKVMTGNVGTMTQPNVLLAPWLSTMYFYQHLEFLNQGLLGPTFYT